MAQAKGKSGDRVDKILAKLRRAGVEHVRFELPDMHGSARSKQVPIEWFAQFARDGVNMYGGMVDGGTCVCARVALYLHDYHTCTPLRCCGMC